MFPFYPHAGILLFVEYGAQGTAQLVGTFFVGGKVPELSADVGMLLRYKLGIADKFQTGHPSIAFQHPILVGAFRHSHHNNLFGRVQTNLENVLSQYDELVFLVGYHCGDGFLLRMLLLEAEVLQVEGQIGYSYSLYLWFSHDVLIVLVCFL